MFKNRYIFGILVFLLSLQLPALAQYWEYEEILDPALRSSMQGLRAHQVQDTNFIFYTLNIDTPGFVEIGAYNFREKGTGDIKVLPFYRFRSGPVAETNEAMNIYIDADSRGFMMVQFPNTFAYTRDGRLRIDSSGRLVTMQGSYPILNSDGGGAIFIPAGAEVAISKNGSVFADSDKVGQIRVMAFTSKGLSKLVTLNGSFFVSADGQVPETDPSGEQAYGVFQGFLEESNVLKSIVGDIGFYKNAVNSIGKSAKTVSRAMSSAVQLGNP